MSVEISGLSGKQIQNAGDNQKISADRGRSDSNGAPAAAGSDDRVSLTSSATRLQDLAAQVSRLPVVDATMVNEVQRALATGSFQFEPAQAADNLLTQEKELATLETQE